MEQGGEKKESFRGRDGTNDETDSPHQQTRQHFTNINSNSEQIQDCKDENLIDEDILKQDVFFRGNKSNQNQQNKWWERENADTGAKNSSFSEFRLEKLLSSSGKSIYLMHFVNFNGSEDLLIDLLVSNANILITNKDWR